MRAAGRMVLAGVCVLATACGDDDGDGGGGGAGGGGYCEPPEGAYRFVLSERSGTCDIGQFEIISVFNGDLSDFEVGEDCRGSSDVSEDGCEVYVSERCPVEDELGRLLGAFKIDGYLRIDSSTRMSGEMTAQYTFTDGDSCVSTFELSGRRR